MDPMNQSKGKASPKTSRKQERKPVPQHKAPKGNVSGGPRGNVKDVIRVASAPVSMMTQFGPSFVRGGGDAQKGSDFEASDGSERVHFSDTFGITIQAGSSTASYGLSGGGAGTYAASLTPENVSSRLAQYEEMYQWYAFRDLLITYCPLISTNTSVGYNLGINQNTSMAISEGAPSAADVNEYSPSMAGPVYVPQTMKYSYHGKKLWSTSTDTGSDALQSVQAQLQCILDGTPTASTTYGKLRITGAIDFYKQCPVFTTDPALVLRRRISKPGAAIEAVRVRYDRYCSALLDLGRKLGFVAEDDFVKLTPLPSVSSSSSSSSSTSLVPIGMVQLLRSKLS